MQTDCHDWSRLSLLCGTAGWLVNSLSFGHQLSGRLGYVKGQHNHLLNTLHHVSLGFGASLFLLEMGRGCHKVIHSLVDLWSLWFL